MLYFYEIVAIMGRGFMSCNIVGGPSFTRAPVCYSVSAFTVQLQYTRRSLEECYLNHDMLMLCQRTLNA